MAIIHTNLQDIPQFQSVLDSATAAGGNLDSAINAAVTSLSEFDNGNPIFDTITDTQITGRVFDAVGGFLLGAFVLDGSHMLSFPVTLTHFQYIDNSPVATFDMFGNVRITATSETGTWTRLTYQSATLNFDLQGTINDQNLPGLQPFNISTFSLDLSGSPNVHESFQGSIHVSNGVLSGTVTAVSLEVDGQYIQATGLNHNAAILNSSDANFIESSFLNGNDTIFGEGTNQTLDGFGGNDTIIAGAGADILNGGTGNDTLNGNDGNDTLNGGAGADNLQGGAGDDAMNGGAGNDTYVVDSLSDTVTETLAGAAGGTDLVQSSAASFTLGANVENLTLTGAVDIAGLGNALNNILTGNSGHNQLSGLAGNDRLIGGLGNDTLDGGAGTDNMAGGLGNDTYTVDVVTDVVTEALNAGTDEVGASLNYTLGANVENLTLTGAALNGTGNALANVLTGNALNNLLSGLAGTDTLIGGVGNDQLLGGLGQDTVNGGLGDDRITLLVTAGNVDTIDAGDGNDTLVLSGVVPGNHVVVVDLSSSTDQVVSIGGVLDDTLAQVNVENLSALGLGSSVNVTGSDGDNNIIGTNGNDSITGGDGNDSITGGAGNDTLDGGVGNDTLIGGTGNDTYTVDSAGDLVTEALTAGTDKVFSSIDYTLTTNVENLELTGNANLNATGNALANILTGNDGDNIMTGNAGNDTLDGGAGDDTLDGGIGNDIIVIGTAADHGGGEVINGGAGADVIFFSGTDGETLTLTDQVTAVEQVVIGTAPGSLVPLVIPITNLNVNAAAVGNSLSITGNAGDNVLTGTSANDTLNGGAGHDTLNGGAGTNTLLGDTGNDRYMVDASTNLVIEGLAAGTDTVVASLNYTLTANVENLELTGTALTGTGNGLANVLTGTSGNDTLSGLVGNDTLIGGAGQDTVTGGTEHDRIVMLVTAGDVDIADGGAGTDTLALVGVVDGDGVVVVNLASLTDQVTRIGTVASEALVQKNFENLDASGLGSSVTVTGIAGANAIIGSNGADSINGGAGNDTLNGGTGDDAMDGGAGNDTSIVDSLGDTVTETLAGFAGGIDTVQSSVNFTLGANVENLTLLGGTDIYGTGNALNNVLTGNSGHNTLYGNAGNDTLIGGDGNDHLSGDEGNDKLIGGDGDDLLLGGPGNNMLIGGKGNDSYFVFFLTDVVTEALNAGTDTVVAHLNYTLGANLENLTLAALPGNLPINGTGNALNNIITGFSGDNLLSGLAGNDQLDGGDGNDTLNGGLGIDVMTGGSGNDLFILDTFADTVIEASGEGSDTVRLAYNVAGPTLIDLNSDYGGNIENVQATGTGVFNITGNADANSLTGNASSNILIGGDGNDTLNGGAGADNQQGGTGDDLILIASATELAATEVVDGGADTDTLRFTSAVAGTLTLTANVTNIEQVQIATAAGLTTGLAAINVNAAAVANGLTIVGNNGANQLTGTGQADTLIGNGGNDTLRGGLGNDTYQVNRGNGQDTISENDSTIGNSDTLLYEATINPLDLVLSRQVNDLRIALHGTAERITIQNWYAPTTAQVETIQAGNGQTLLNTQVDQLIQAMAQFTTDTGLSWDQGIVQQPAEVQSILAASWQ